ncbi:hypothetical protein KF840_04500 [bacterium]|nr:hypothetical protein [bacterium]
MAEQRARVREVADRGNGHDDSMADLQRQARRLTGELSEMRGTLHALVGDCRAVARQQLERQPYVVIAVAAGLGYVLGGGLPRGVVSRLLLCGGRVALERAIANLAASAAGTAPAR